MSYPFPDLRTDSENENAMNVSSGQDCTGLIPADPTAAEEENYSELYDFLPKAVSDGKNDGV